MSNKGMVEVTGVWIRKFYPHRRLEILLEIGGVMAARERGRSGWRDERDY